MRLKTLRLHGFKSFANRTDFEFRAGVTAIVGSNGCGKSNIADAVRWVLGEQRASALRGAKMEEVIFQGTARRRPLNFAEVSLLFDNESGRVPVPQTELEVTRKVFREGGSDYSLNRASCRLRDIQSLLRDTGLGSNAYAIIEATMIEALLNERADERRALFEEAAGIGRYKDSRHSATRRLEASEADLARLDDLIAEVESKVRSLSRQKRKAERHRELQARRLDLEVAIAREEVARLEGELAACRIDHARSEEAERVAGAERSRLETVLEAQRIEAADLGRERTAGSARLEAVRARLDAREREVLVSGERRKHAELRAEQLGGERQALQTRIAGLEVEIAERDAECAVHALRVAEERQRSEAKVLENLEVRSALAAARAAAESAAEHARGLAREIATREGERAGAERRGREARERHAEMSAELDRIRLELGQMTGQTELWQAQAEEIRIRRSAAVEGAEAARSEVSVLQGREQRAREEVRLAEDRLSTLAAQVEAREALERSYEGFAPAVAAIMGSRDRFPGVHGPLADYVREPASEEGALAVESFLGPLLQALVVEDLATARAVRDWYRRDWTEGGSLVLLPLDALQPAGTEDAAAPVQGARWIEVLLDRFVAVSDDPLSEFLAGANRVGPEGEIVDARGVIRLSERGGGQGILSRRDALARMRRELAAARKHHSARLRERDALRTALSEAEERAVAAEEHLRVENARLQTLEMDAAAFQVRRDRLREEGTVAEATLTRIEADALAATAELAALQARLEELARSVQSSGEGEAAARQALVGLEGGWDAAREAEAELRVSLARAESDQREAERRRQLAGDARASAGARADEIDRELAQLQATVQGLAASRESATGEIEALFQERDRESGALAVLDARLAELDSDLAELGERARIVRRAEADAAEARHRLDLRLAEARSQAERVRDRLEAEWGRPWSALLAEASDVDGDPEAWRNELRGASEQLDGLGPVNMLAVEEHAEEDRRLTFLTSQRDDLVGARDNLVAAIRQINRTAREVFQSTFDTVRLNFRRTFHSLFQGGECDLWLVDPDDPLDSDVEIRASPEGKKTQRLHLLSGGERTLTALALLFALYLVKPSPFCILDEVDAPLDDTNVGRFIRLLEDFKHETQFIVITHNPRTMEAADWVYGVTMEDPGISSIVGVELLGAWALDHEAASPAPTS